jgi:probable O-glycosylation ligase (exosortase A-associated)
MLFKLILLYIIVEYVRPGDISPELRALNLNTFFLPLSIFVVSIVRWKASYQKYFISSTQSRMILFLTGLHAISLVMAQFIPDVDGSLIYQSTRGWIGYTLVFFFLSNGINSDEKLEKIIKTLIFIHVFVILINLNTLTKASHQDFLQSGTFFGDGNDFALALNVILPLALFFALGETKKLGRIVFRGIVLLFFLAIIFTLSRGGAVGLAASVGYFAITSSRKYRNGIWVVILCIAAVYLAPPSWFQRMETIQSYDTEASAHGRIQAWKAAIQIALDRPLTGVGPGNFLQIYATKYRPEHYSIGDAWKTAHSLYFQTLAELGFPGIFGLVVMLGSTIISNIRMQSRFRLEAKDRQVLLSFNMSWIGYIVTAGFLSVLYYPHIFVLAGINLAARNILRMKYASGWEKTNNRFKKQ